MRLPSPWSGAIYNQDGFYSNLLWHNVGLSAAEVETLYNYGSPIKTLANIPQNSNLKAWYKLDASEIYNSTSTEWSVDNNQNPSAYPSSLNFDAASSDYIDCGNDSSLQITGNLSISAWINVESGSGNYAGIVSKYKSNLGFELQLNGNTNSLRYYDPTGSNNPSASNVLTVGTWHHVVVSVNNSTGNIIIYVDNISVATGTANASRTDSGYALQIGRDEDKASPYYFDGKISNASVWNAALTPAQVTELYNEGVPSNLNNHSAYSNLVSWWQLGSNSSFNTNWTVLDEKGSNNGTSSNMGEDAIVDGVGSYANGLSSGMGGDEVIGDAPYSSSNSCLLYTSPSPRDRTRSRMPSSA